MEGSKQIFQLKMLNYPFNSLCRIETRAMNGAKGLGTGILLAPNIMLTALHVIAPKGSVKPLTPQEIKVFVGQNGAAT